MATRSTSFSAGGTTSGQNIGTSHTVTVTNNSGFAATAGAFTNCSASPTSVINGGTCVITPSGSGVISTTFSWVDANKNAFNHVVSGTAYGGTIGANPTSVAAGGSVTFAWTMSPSGTPTYNSTTSRWSTPQSGNMPTSGTSGNLSKTAQQNPSGASWTGSVTIRIPGQSGVAYGVIDTSPTVTIYSVPSTPSDITFSGVTETQITATAVAGTNDYGTLQVRQGTSGTWLTSPQTFTGLTAGTSYTFQARQSNVSAVSGTRQETQSTSQTVDETPNAFPFTDVISAYKSTTQTSNEITVAGLGTGVNASVSITGGTYSKNGGGYTSAATTAANGDTFRVRHTSSSGNYGLVTTSLTIGTVTEDYTSRTIDTAITVTLTHNGGDISGTGLYNSVNGAITVGISGGRNNTNYRGVVTAASSSPSGTATLNTGIGNNTPSSTTVNLSIGESAFEFSSIQGDQVSYKIQARTVTSLGGSGTGSWVDTGNSFTLTHIVTTPSGFTVTQGAVNASSTPITLTADGTATPTDCVKEFRLTTSGSFGSTSTTNQNWGTTVTYATRFRNSTTGQTSLFGNEITRFVGDPAVSIAGSALQYNSTESFTHTRAITNTVANTSFRVKNTQATQGNSAGAVAVEATATGTSLNLNLTSPTDIPAAGDTVDYTTEFRVTAGNNGDGVWRSLPSGITAQNFTIGRQSTFAFTDTTNQNINVEQNSFVEINGLVSTVTASLTGAGTFAVSSSSSQPGAVNYTTANKNVTSTNRFVHARHTSASTLSTNTDTTINIDGISDTFRSTTASSLPADVTITINFTDGVASQNEPSFLNVVSSRSGQGTGQTGSSTNPIPLDFGDVVQFTYSATSTSLTTCDVGNFDSGEWTNISNITNLDPGDNAQKIRPSSGISIGEQDQILIQCDGDVPNSQFLYFVQRYNEGDQSVSFPTTVQMAENDSSYSLTISARGDATNQANTVYEIRDGNSSSTLRGSRTGAGTITVTTGFPQFLGIGVDKFVYYRLPTANGGDNVLRSVVNDDGDGHFTLFRGSAPGANNPTKTGFGIAIYDDTESLVTSFQENHTVLRTIFSGTATTSTSAPIDIETSISGLSSNNSVIMVTGNASASGGSSEYPLNIPTRFNGTKVRVARWTSATSIKVTVMQYSGGTLTGTAPSYGAKIYNEDGNLVLDNLASSYAVKEVINISTSNPGGLGGTSVAIYTGFSQSTVNYAYITLAAGRYPTSGGLPIPAIACTSGNAALIAPRVAGVVSGSYRYVYCTLPANVATSNFKVAMLVERANTTPSYYGGSASAYGLRIKDGSGNIQFDSSWRQAIVQNVITCNQFPTGTGIVSQNGSYDVETGSDGVQEPIVQGGLLAEFTQATYSTGQTKTLTGLNSVDPTNTYLLGGFPQGGVKYYAQPWYLDGVEQEVVGGGTHVPAISITGNTTCVISMYRTGGGPGPPTESDYGERVATSSHPHGTFILARII